MTTIKIHNVETGDIVERDMTKDESDALKKQNDADKAIEADRQAKNAAKEALLAKLGITAEEAALLLK
jgi:hypothetical protein